MLRVVAFILLTAALCGCESAGKPSWNTAIDPAQTTATLQDPEDTKYHRSDEPLRLAHEHFGRGDFGTAERYYRDAVEKSPKDVQAWIGLAASYDRTGRFDLANAAYKRAIELGGETPQLLNNLGYSYMLQGKLTLARAKFKKALERDPGNPMIVNNIELLNGSSRFIQREPAAME